MQNKSKAYVLKTSALEKLWEKRLFNSILLNNTKKLGNFLLSFLLRCLLFCFNGLSSSTQESHIQYFFIVIIEKVASVQSKVTDNIFQ